MIASVLYNAYDVFKVLRKHFESDEWEEKSKKEGRAVIKMKFFYAEKDKDGYGMSNLDDDMSYLTRPVIGEEFETLKGIKGNYQFIPLKCGLVGMRKFSCFCKQCYLNSLYNKPTSVSLFNLGGCNSSSVNQRDYLYHKLSCAMITGKRASKNRENLRTYRKDLVKDLNEGDFVYFQANSSDDFGEKIWLGRLVRNTENHEFKYNSVWKNDSGRRVWIGNIRIDINDLALNIQWYERTGLLTDTNVYQYKPLNEPPQVQNSTQIVTGSVKLTMVRGKESRRSYRISDQKTESNKDNVWELNEGRNTYEGALNNLQN